MFLDVTTILKNDGSGLDIDFDEGIDLTDVLEGYEVDKPISFKGRLQNEKGILNLTGKLTVPYSMNCSRCLSKIEDILRVNITEDIVAYSDDKEEYTYGDKNTVELNKILTDYIVLNVPLVKLCIMDCKGLCYTCGKNLNEEKCNCTSKSIDPRLDVLKKLLE